MIKLAGELRRADFYDYLRRFGFGTRTAVGLPAESSGLLRHVTEWSDRSLETIAIGQEVSVTALQLVQAFGAIANGGTLMAPRVVDEVHEGPERRVTPVQKVRRVISNHTASRLQRMLAGVVTEGTGKAAAIDGFTVAGKTGTAQRALIDGAGYAEDEYIASFVGFVPATSPRYLALVVIENPRVGKYGGVVAAPAFRRTMERVLELDGSLEGIAEPIAVPVTLVGVRIIGAVVTGIADIVGVRSGEKQGASRRPPPGAPRKTEAFGRSVFPARAESQGQADRSQFRRPPDLL